MNHIEIGIDISSRTKANKSICDTYVTTVPVTNIPLDYAEELFQKVALDIWGTTEKNRGGAVVTVRKATVESVTACYASDSYSFSVSYWGEEPEPLRKYKYEGDI